MYRSFELISSKRVNRGKKQQSLFIIHLRINSSLEPGFLKYTNIQEVSVKPRH